MSVESHAKKDKSFMPLPDPNGNDGSEPIKSLLQSVSMEDNKKAIGNGTMLADKIVEPKKNIFIQGGRELVIGDLHFGHRDIIKTAPRPFANVAEMNQFMIDCWNSVVTNNDTVFVLGDFFDFDHCDDDEVRNILDNLHGHIILIAGNHDRGHLDLLRNCGIEVIEYPIIKDGFWFLSHEPMFVTETAPYANIFAHVHLNPMYKTVSARSFCVSAERIGYTPILLSEVKRMVCEHVDE